ncbi:hypothetical protein SO694_00008050 [Aureococcus anophagefferens]|uniref:DUF1279 domain-containing protein n=1 Tax=Aureococcus anophagefferens TaxID=44056 RepID=A0ABR1GDB1_AURAN
MHGRHFEVYARFVLLWTFVAVERILRNWDMEAPGAPTSPPASPTRKSKFDLVHENKLFANKHKDTLAFAVFALKFSGYSFLALGVLQTLAKAPGLPRHVAYGVFLLDAARRVNKLCKQESKKAAQDQLVDALDSVAQCHAIFAWVTIMAAGGLFADVSGLKAWGLRWAEEHDVVNAVLGYNESYWYSFKGVVAAGGAAGLKFGGYDYMVGKVKYWTKASKIGAEMANHKYAKLLAKKPKEE